MSGMITFPFLFLNIGMRFLVFGLILLNSLYMDMTSLIILIPSTSFLSRPVVVPSRVVLRYGRLSTV